MEAWRHAISICWGKQQPVGANAGLLKDKFLRALVDDVGENDTAARTALFRAMSKSIIQSEAVYRSAYRRQIAYHQKLRADGLFSTSGRMIIGLGGENVLETGLTLHHTYGTPIIPGTALKGLASHYCDQVWGTREKDKVSDRWQKGELNGDYHKTLFGTTEDSGHITFHDAWITPETLAKSLQPDVMTPHHRDYYSGKAAPTDFDDPKPVTFLSVVGTFNVVVSCDVIGAEGQKWAKLAFDLLTEALEEWGIGGKTNAGYGRLVLANSGNMSEQSSARTDDSNILP
jgi:CRISPR-associated protein Cmr6